MSLYELDSLIFRAMNIALDPAHPTIFNIAVVNFISGPLQFTVDADGTIMREIQHMSPTKFNVNS